VVEANLIGRTLSHYKITGTIGSGGMGEVFSATDTKLGRVVALKVLPAEVASDPDRLARFQREARSAAALNHPHIVTLHSVEEADGVTFLTMELVEGEPLDRLISQGPFPLERIVEIAGELADALAAAHEKGIVHRDLKPANVMITRSGHVKVLDFGLAKDTRDTAPADETRTSVHHTQAGMVMGTPAYMSPEQIAGRPLDHRTDIFSMGVILHELAAGRRPFDGASSAELISAVLRDTPPPVTEIRPELPEDLARIIRRCLEKEPRDRMQTALDVRNEFRDLAKQLASYSHKIAAGGVASGSPASRMTTATETGARSGMASRAMGSGFGSGGTRVEEGFWVAILPFKASGANADLAALAEGLSDEIITGMSRFPYLRVIARSSTARYANEAVDVQAVGKALGARYLIHGHLRLVGTTLRVTVQLTDAVSGAEVWAETYQRKFTPEALFELQDELVPVIVSTIADAHGILAHTMSEDIRGKSAAELTPYEAVLAGFRYSERGTPDEHLIARDALERAVEIAPGYSYAWAMLSITIAAEAILGFNPKADPVGRALAAAHKATELDATNHRAHHALGVARYLQRDKEAMRASLDRAVQLNPMDGCALAHLGGHFAYLGEWEYGIPLVKRAVALNPHHPGWYWFPLSIDAFRRGDYRESLAMTCKINLPGFPFTHVMLAAAYGQLGELEAGRAAVNDLVTLVPQAVAAARFMIGRIVDGELTERIVDGLRKAGMEIPAGDMVGSHSA
jgi:TolB-like protein